MANISIDDNHFTPSDLVVHVGDTVTWTNNNIYNGKLFFGAQAAGPPDAGVLANGGVGTFSYTFGVTGVYSMSFKPESGGAQPPFTGSVEVI